MVTKKMNDLFDIQDDETQPNQKEEDQRLGAGIEFCSNCKNMLTPQEDKTTPPRLIYVCKSCGHSQESKDTCVYVNTIKRQEKYGNSRLEKSGLFLDCSLRRKMAYCKECKQVVKVIVYAAPSYANQEKMEEIYECQAHHKWSSVDNTNDDS